MFLSFDNALYLSAVKIQFLNHLMQIFRHLFLSQIQLTNATFLINYYL